MNAEKLKHRCRLNMVYASQFNPELMPYIPLWNLRRALPTASLYEQDRYIRAGLKLGVWSLVRYPEKRVRLYCSKGTGYMHLGNEVLAIEMQAPRIVWDHGTFITKTAEQQAWAKEYRELSEELDAPVEGFVLA